MAIQEQQKISALQLHELLHQQPSPLVIDVRSKDQYEAGHIPAARNIPEGEVLEVLTKPTLNRPVVVYCNMQHPGSSGSERAAEQLRQAGYEAQVLEGGFPAWKDAGYDVEMGYTDSARFFGSEVK